jgi:tRNA(adenine34) deaminase
MKIGKPNPTDEKFIGMVIDEANRIIDEGKVGVVALLAWGDEKLGMEHNTYEETHDMTAHGEMSLLRKLAKRLDAMSEDDRKKLTLYSTLEPCLMCFGALTFLGIRRMVYSALIEDMDEEGSTLRDMTCGELGRHLKDQNLELVEGVRRSDGQKIIARMGHDK